MISKQLFAQILMLVLFAGVSLTQQTISQQAQQYFSDQDWENAMKAYEKVVATEPENGRAWLSLGLSYHNLKEYAQAIPAFQKADDLGFAQPQARFHAARSLARLGKLDDSFNWLEKANAAGFGQLSRLDANPDLEILRSDARFAEIKKGTDRNARPCEYNPDCRAFDFWIGEWEVFNPNGQKVGENVIEKSLNGCMLLENWTSSGGGDGKSMNYWDPAAKKWRQLWVDGTGGHMAYEGVFQDGALHFEGYQIQGNGAKSLFKMIFTPQENGDVRQYIEQSLDEGKTFNVWFDGMYKKKAMQ